MYEWLKHFFTVESYFTGIMRIAFAAVGTELAAGTIAGPQWLEVLGRIIVYIVAGASGKRVPKKGQKMDA
jgi:hypothetical protein